MPHRTFYRTPDGTLVNLTHYDIITKEGDDAILLWLPVFHGSQRRKDTVRYPSQALRDSEFERIANTLTLLHASVTYANQ